ncbi:MAG: MarR family winged helix-turn-helix transcriptional regulator [Armatimonadota bacterium]
MKKESIAYAEHLLDLFAETLHRITTEEPLRAAGGKVTPSLAGCLQFLLRHGVCSVRDIAEGLSMTYSAASQLTDRLVRRELAARSENERDRRLSEIRLTERGRSIVEKIRLRRVAGMARVLNRMDPEKRANLVGNLENFIAAAIEDEKGALDTCSHCGSDHVSDCVVNEIYRAVTGTPIERV